VTLPQPTDVDAAYKIGLWDTPPWDDIKRDPNNPADWNGFRIYLEYNLHNVIHRYVGGAMALMASPNDPVFWLHHANIDRIWAIWQAIHGMSTYPSSGAPKGQNRFEDMIFHGSGPAPWNGQVSPDQTFDYAAMGFTYDPDPKTTSIAPAQEKVSHGMPMFPLPKELPGLSAITRLLRQAGGKQ
jgi:tyrosinase